MINRTKDIMNVHKCSYEAAIKIQKILDEDVSGTLLSNERKATDAQLAYIKILGGEVSPTLTCVEASNIIDSLINAKAEKEAEEHLYNARLKEEKSLKILAYETGNDYSKIKKSHSKRIQDIRNFQMLINTIISDNIIEIDEILKVKKWLIEHQILNTDFSKMIKLIDDVVLDNKIDENETQKLYEGMLDCIIELRNRQI